MIKVMENNACVAVYGSLEEWAEYEGMTIEEIRKHNYIYMEVNPERIKFNDLLFDNELQEIDMSDIDSIEFVNNSNGDGIYYITNCDGLVYACKTYEEIL